MAIRSVLTHDAIGFIPVRVLTWRLPIDGDVYDGACLRRLDDDRSIGRIVDLYIRWKGCPSRKGFSRFGECDVSSTSAGVVFGAQRRNVVGPHLGDERIRHEHRLGPI